MSMSRAISITSHAHPQVWSHVELCEAVEQLPESERLILALYYQEELTLEEIGQVLELPELVVHQRRARALHTLRLALGPAAADLLPR